MAGEILADRNVLVYAHDRAEPRKQGRALDTLRPLVASGRGRLSAQDGQVLDGVGFADPFARAFDLATIG